MNIGNTADICSPPIRGHWVSFDFTSLAANVSVETINALAAGYDPEKWDSVTEYVRTLGVNKDDQRLVKAAIRRIRR